MFKTKNYSVMNAQRGLQEIKMDMRCQFSKLENVMSSALEHELIVFRKGVRHDI